MKSIVFVLVLPIACYGYAAGTYYANSCSYTDVNDCVNGSRSNSCHSGPYIAGAWTGVTRTHTAATGDVIVLPGVNATSTTPAVPTCGNSSQTKCDLAGNSNCWTQTLNVPALVYIQGQDPSNTSAGACVNAGGTPPTPSARR